MRKEKRSTHCCIRLILEIIKMCTQFLIQILSDSRSGALDLFPYLLNSVQKNSKRVNVREDTEEVQHIPDYCVLVAYFCLISI